MPKKNPVETPAARFERLALRKVRSVIRSMRSLGRVRGASQEQADKIVAALRTELESLEYKLGGAKDGADEEFTF